MSLPPDPFAFHYTPVPPPPRRPGLPRRLAFLVTLLVLLSLGASAYFLYRALRPGPAATEPRAVTPRGDLAEDEKSTIALFKESVPSVVFITTAAQRIDLRTRNVFELPAGSGSGFFWDEAGHVVTNFHVIQNASSATVTTNGHDTFRARLVGVAPEYDLAVLKVTIPQDRVRPIPVGESGNLQVGQKVFAIGNPFGLDQTLTTGIVSALGRTIRSVTNQPIEDVIQTDAAINPGNSGGPLLDSAGRLVGVNTAIYSPSGSSAGIGFAVPVDTVNAIVPQLITKGRVARPQIGVQLEDRISESILRQMGVEGVLVMGVQPASPAEAAGLRGTQRAPDGSIVPGDVIQKVDGKTVKSAEQFRAILGLRSAGQTITLTVFRGGQTEQVQVPLRESTTLQ